MAKCMRCFIAGRVQGVSFRAATRERALQLGLQGWVRNLPDGRVEVLACGEQRALDALQEWLWTGPDLAYVTSVEYQGEPSRDYHGFDVR